MKFSKIFLFQIILIIIGFVWSIDKNANDVNVLVKLGNQKEFLIENGSIAVTLVLSDGEAFILLYGERDLKSSQSYEIQMDNKDHKLEKIVQVNFIFNVRDPKNESLDLSIYLDHIAIQNLTSQPLSERIFETNKDQLIQPSQLIHLKEKKFLT